MIQIEMPVRYGTLDLAALTWMLAGVTDRETRVEQELVKDTSDGLTLQWTVTGDWAAVPVRYQDAVVTCYALGLLNGQADGTFGGNNYMTRAQACVVINRLQG